ncbi:MAG: (2Fe-2S)-binding protein [Bacteroidales bacterium]|nr:(2Fe-2S)-binding protein [Bacteroidales bacterium]
MHVIIEVNGRRIKAEKGETILSALNSNGIDIPTFCRLPGLTPTGACRICVVEVEGSPSLVTACSQPVSEWMKIKTHSSRVVEARRTIVELLLSSHPHDCLSCDRNLACELQNLAYELNLREKQQGNYQKQGRKGDLSGEAITREPVKCIVCGRCVRVCEEEVGAGTFDFLSRGENTHIGVAMDYDLNLSNCLFCGQCVKVCPTSALHEKSSISEVEDYLADEKTLTALFYSPLAAYGVAEEMGLRFTALFERQLNSALRNIGFHRIYSTGSGTDIMLSLLAEELATGRENGRDTPIYSSHCPSWIKHAEQSGHNLLKDISKLKTPQLITGTLIPLIQGEEAGREEVKVRRVSVSPCLAAKFDARRDNLIQGAQPGVDSVLTVRELVRLLKLYGIDLAASGSGFADEPLSLRSFTADLAEISGGVAEGVARILSETEGGPGLTSQDIKRFRTPGLYREISFSTSKRDYLFAVVDGLTSFDRLKEGMDAGRKFDFVEVVVCRGGCVNGGGLGFGAGADGPRERYRQIVRGEENHSMPLPSRNPETKKLLTLIQDKRDDNGNSGYTDIAGREYIERDVLM